MTSGPLETEMSVSEAGLERLGGGGGGVVARQRLRKEAGLPSGELRGRGC